jgi:uncharacterized protein (DUF1501 family)
MNRREFTKKLAFTGSSISLQLSLMQSVAAQTATGEYKAVVCLLLAGGIDSYRMLLPLQTTQYSNYLTLRGLAASGLDNSSNYTRIGLSEYGLNNQFNGVWADSSTQNNVAFVANVGALTQPINCVRDFVDGAKIPFALTSHNDQQQQLQTLDHSGQSAVGWMSRLIESHLATNPSLTNFSSANISLSGMNYAQSSQTSGPLSISSAGPAQLQPVSTNTTSARVISHKNALFNDFDSIMGCADYKRNVMQRLYAESSKAAYTDNLDFNSAFSSAVIPADLPGSMNTLVKAMKAGMSLGLKRQTFFLVFGNWDNHADLLTVFDSNVNKTLNPFLRDFRIGMKKAGLWNNVTLFTTSDFGRTLVPNSSGTDHAWGGNHIVMGGGVNAGVYGKYPKMELKTASNIEDPDMRDVDGIGGMLIPSVSWDEYLAPIARWFIPDISVSALNAVLPNLSNFSGTRPAMNFM